jgi:hypothetical protein
MLNYTLATVRDMVRREAVQRMAGDKPCLDVAPQDRCERLPRQAARQPARSPGRDIRPTTPRRFAIASANSR